MALISKLLSCIFTLILSQSACKFVPVISKMYTLKIGFQQTQTAAAWPYIQHLLQLGQNSELAIESIRRNNRHTTCHQSTAKVKAQSFTIILMAVASDIKRFACHFPSFSLTPTVTSWHMDVNVRYGDSLKTQIAMGRRITAN